MQIIHHNDGDGRCSVAIILEHLTRRPNDAKPDRLDLVEMDYNKELDIDAISPDEELYIVDFSLKPDVMAEVLNRTENVVWIDHHATAGEYDYGRELAGLRNFELAGEAACELCWRFCFPEFTPPLAVILMGDYDKWSHKYAPRDSHFYEGLKLRDYGPIAPIWTALLAEGGDPTAEQLVKDGETAIKYRDAYCADYCNSYGFETDFEGHRCYAANLYKFGSHAYGGKIKEYPVCIAFAFDGSQFIVSLYSDTGVDVSEICKRYGGGGHKGAAGFQCKKLPFSK